MTAGAVASFVGNPCDLMLVRLQADAALPIDQRRNYKHAGDAFVRIFREEGVQNLWRGTLPTMARCVVLSTCMFVTYDTAIDLSKATMGPEASNISIQVGASAIASLAAAVSSLPFDNIKTKIQK